MVFHNEIKKFAKGDTTLYEGFNEYFFKEGANTPEHAEKLQSRFLSEVESKSHVSREDMPEAWAANPQVKWAGLAIVNAVVNSLLPQTLNPNIGLFTNLRMVGAGDIVKIKVLPRTLYTVSLGGRGERTSFRQKDYAQDVVLNPEEHIVTVFTDFYRVMANLENIADFIQRVMLSIETEMGRDAALTLQAGVSSASYPSSLKVTGAFDAQKLIKLCQTVQAYNYGMKPVILGTAAALANIAPDSSLGYRGQYNAENGVVRVMKDFYTFTPIELPQYAAGSNPDDGLALADNVLYVISPMGNKLVEGVVSVDLTNTNDWFDNADITENFTMRKLWNFAWVSAAWGATYTITE